MKHFFAIAGFTFSAAGLNLDDPAVNFECFMRTRGDTTGEEVVGSVCSFIRTVRGRR